MTIATTAAVYIFSLSLVSLKLVGAVNQPQQQDILYNFTCFVLLIGLQ